MANSSDGETLIDAINARGSGPGPCSPPPLALALVVKTNPNVTQSHSSAVLYRVFNKFGNSKFVLDIVVHNERQFKIV